MLEGSAVSSCLGEKMENWQDAIGGRRLRGVQVATALFALSRYYIEEPEILHFSQPQMVKTWPLQDEESLQALEAIAEAEDSLFAVRQDFRQLCGPQGVIPMAESEYVGVEPLTLVQKLAAQYSSFGYDLQKTGAFPRDHFGVQLGFAGQLVIQFAQDGEPGDGRVRATLARLLEEHINSYADELLEQIAKAAQTGTYRGVPALTSRALAAAAELTGE